MSPSASVLITRVSSFPTAVKQQNPLKRKRYDDDITQERTVLMATHKEDDDEHEPPSPSWEVLCLLGSYMDPETLALASCVSTAWLNCFSSEYLWRSKQTAYEPFNFVAALETTERKISYKRLISTLESDAKRRRKNKLAEPKISLSDLVFTIYVSSESKEATVLIKGKDLAFGSNERFQIEADVSDRGFVAGMRDVRMVWQVMYKDYNGLFTILDFTRSSVEANSGWLTKELPAPENRYLGDGGSNVVGDVKPSFNGEVLDKVGFAMLNLSTCGSLFVDDVLRYLQCFLVDC